MSEITRSPGLAVGTFTVGGGYTGCTESLDATVMEAAEVLRQAYGMPVTIRFNSNRRSGGAWLVTDAVDGVWLNAEVGICANDHGMVMAHVGKRVGEYAHEPVESIAAALAYVQRNADLSKLESLAA